MELLVLMLSSIVYGIDVIGFWIYLVLLLSFERWRFYDHLYYATFAFHLAMVM